MHWTFQHHRRTFRATKNIDSQTLTCSLRLAGPRTGDRSTRTYSYWYIDANGNSSAVRHRINTGSNLWHAWAKRLHVLVSPILALPCCRLSSFSSWWFIAMHDRLPMHAKARGGQFLHVRRPPACTRDDLRGSPTCSVERRVKKKAACTADAGDRMADDSELMAE